MWSFSEIVTATGWTEGSVLNLTIRGMTFQFLNETGKCAQSDRFFKWQPEREEEMNPSVKIW